MDKLARRATVEAAKVTPVTRQSSQQEFTSGDKVKVFTENGTPVKGIVRSYRKYFFGENVVGIEVVSFIIILHLWDRNPKD